jgi:hypothetical protein
MGGTGFLAKKYCGNIIGKGFPSTAVTISGNKLQNAISIPHWPDFRDLFSSGVCDTGPASRRCVKMICSTTPLRWSRLSHTTVARDRKPPKAKFIDAIRTDSAPVTAMKRRRNPTLALLLRQRP